MQKILVLLIFYYYYYYFSRNKNFPTGFTANLEIREIVESSGNLKMDPFLLKNHGILIEYQGNQGKLTLS